VFYTRREALFLRWLRTHRREINGVHLQEGAPWTLALMAWACHRLEIPIYLTVHSIHPHESQHWHQRLGHRLNRMSYSTMDQLFVHTGIRDEVVRTEVTADRSRVTTIDHGLFGVESDPFANGRSGALMFGVLRRNKGVLEFLDVARELPAWQFTLAGGCNDEHFATQIRARVPSNVEYLDEFIAESSIGRLMDRTLVCVLPYQDYEAQSGVLHLAIGSGVPVLVTPVGGLPEIVERFGCGVIAGGTDPASIAAALRTFEDPLVLERTRLGVQGAQQALGWKSAAKATADVYRRHMRVEATGDTPI
jgi:glycosyltransferase involved in cell wall biosynthesis